jgi:hypothetical protein
MNVPLSHDMPCLACSHDHHLLPCEYHGTCLCEHSPAPGLDL